MQTTAVDRDEATTQPIGGSDLRFGLVTFFLLFGLCAIFAVSTPIGSSPDEPVQIIRAAAVVRGDPGGAMTESPSPGEGQANSVEYHVDIPRSYAEVATQPNCYAFKPDVTAECAPQLPKDDSSADATTYVGSYPPGYYVLVGLPSLVAPANIGVYGMRLVSALLVSLLFALGFVAARRVGGGVLVAVAAVVVTPMAMYLGGTVNPSGVEIAAAFATWMTATALLRRRPADRRPSALTVWSVTIATGALIITRPSGLVIAAVIALTLLVAFADREILTTLAADRRVRWATGTLVAIAVLTVTWIVYAKSFGTFVGVPVPGLTKRQIVEHAMTNHSELLRQMVGVFGWLDAVLPDQLWWLWGGVAVIVVVAGFVVATLRVKAGMVVAVLIGVIAPPLTQVTNAQRYGYIWSGRYQLPFAMGVVLLAGVALSYFAARRSWSTWPVRIGSLGIGALVAGGMAVAYVIVMQRFVTGVVSGRFDYLQHPEWHPRISPMLTTLALAVVAAAWGAWIAATGWQASRHEPD